MRRRWNLTDPIVSALLSAVTSVLFSSVAWAGPADSSENLLAVEINQLKVSEGVLVLKDMDGSLWLRAEDLFSWRIRVPDAGGEVFDGRMYFRADDLAGLDYQLDDVSQTLKIVAHPGSLMATGSINLSRPMPRLTSSGVGGFLNYELFGRVTPDTSGESALFELGLFNHWGVGLNTFAFEEGRAGGRGIRLETTLIRDWPEKLSTLRLGDSLTRTASLIGGVTRFAGLQYGTNFSTQPQLITTPLQSVSGETGLPSVAEIYVNNNLIQRHDIPAGGFSITGIPSISGTGEVTVVVRDVLGREQVITQPFYSSPLLLAEGLSDYSFEVGAEREYFASRSADYGRPLASATWRKGVTGHLTAETHGEWTKDHFNLGVGGIWLLPRHGVLGGGLAGSNADGQSGYLSSLTYEYNQQGYSLGMRQQWASRHYAQLGLDAGEMLPASQSSVFGGLSMDKAGSLALAWFRQEKRGETDSEFVTLSYQVRLPRRGTLLFNYLQTLTGDKARAATLSFIFPFGDRSTASYQHRNDLKRDGDADVHYLTLQQSLPAGEGWGYRVQVSDREENEAGLAYQGPFGTYSADILQRSDGMTTQFMARGGLGWLSGKMFASRVIDESFAMVDVSGRSGVRVYVENQLAGKTDRDGKLLLPQLRAYEENDVRIDHRDLPMDAEIESLRLKITPHFRSGALAGFKVRRLRPALLTLVLDDGSPIPSDARLTKADGNKYYFVGMNGLVYVDDMDDETNLRAEFGGRSCMARVSMPDTNEAQPDLGRQVCKEIGP